MKPIKTAARAALSSLLLLSTAALATPALADPIKIESENVTFYGDVDPELAKERVRKWEIYRRMVFALSGIANPPADENKLTVYGFYDTDDLQDFTDSRGIAGVYTQGIAGPIFLTSINNKYTEDGFSEQVGLHEYTHHILNAAVKQGFPRWYDEGFANYLSTMIITEDGVAVGDPTAGHAKVVKEGRAEWIDPETVLSAITFYPNYSRYEMRRGGPTSFYAQSWLYVHYMRSKPELNGKLADYLKLVDTPGVAPVDAFEEAFGISSKKFHRDAAKYFRKNDFAVTAYKPGPAIMDVEMKASKMTEAELRVAQVPARLAFLGDGNERDFTRDLGIAYEADPNDPMITFGYVTMDLRNERYDNAVNRGEAAMMSDPDNVTLIRAAADARYHRYVDPLVEEMDDDYVPYELSNDMKVSLDYYKRILDQNPVDADAIDHIIGFYGNSEEPITDEVFQAARIKDLRYMDSFEPFTGMSLATIYAKRGFTLDACDYYEKSMDSVKQFKDKQLGAFKGRLAWFGEKYGQTCQIGDDEN